jgi:hypothetical protein
MFQNYSERLGHIHRLLNVSQFIKDVSTPGGGGTISTGSGSPATTGVMLGGAQGIPTTVHKGGTPTASEVLGHMDSLKSQGVKFLGGWNPEKGDVPEEKEGIQLDAVSQHTPENVGEAFKERPDEYSAYHIDKGEEIKNPHYKGD